MKEITTKDKLKLLLDIIMEIQSRIDLIDCNNENDYINQGHLETLAKHCRKIVIHLHNNEGSVKMTQAM